MLKDDGKFIVSTPNPDKKNGQEFVWPDDHCFEYSYDELISVFKTDFSLVDSYGWWINSKYMHNTLVKNGETDIMHFYSKLRDVLPPSILDPVFCMLYPRDAKQVTYIFRPYNV